MAYAVPYPAHSPTPPPSADFTYKPGFIIAGETVNFTEKASGGVPPYTFGWKFGDGSSQITGQNWTLHKYPISGTYTVTMNVTDSAAGFNSISYAVTANEWPISAATAYGWNVPWNLTQTDGVNIHDVTYHGTLIVRDARLAAVQVLYLNNFCGPFYDEEGQSDLLAVKSDGHIYYQNNIANPVNPYFNLTAEYRVGGYDYTEAFLFFKNGEFEVMQTIGRDGCPTDHVYEPHWRIDMALTEDQNNYLSQYTSQGTWQDLLWEGNYTDNGYRDLAHNGTEWRLGDQSRYYYIVPNVVRWDLDLPYVPADLILVRNIPKLVCPGPSTATIECNHAETGHIESPTEFVTGQLAFRRDIALWWVPKVYDHGPVAGLTLSVKVVSLTFYPGGVWT